MHSSHAKFAAGAALTAALVIGGAVATSYALAQEIAVERWITICPAETGDSGRITVINASPATCGVLAEPLTEEPDFVGAVGQIGASPLRPGAARRVDYQITDPSQIASPSAALKITTTQGVLSFVEGRVGGHRFAARVRDRVRASTNLSFPWTDHNDSDPGVMRLGLIAFDFESTTATIDLYDTAGEVVSTQDVMLLPMSATLVVLDLSDGHSATGVRRVQVTAPKPLLADTMIVADSGTRYLSHGRDVAENNQYWFPYVNDLAPELSVANHATGVSYAGDVRLFDPKGVVLGSVGSFTSTPGSVGSVAFDAAPPVYGAICVDVVTGTAPRAPAVLLSGKSDFTTADPMRRVHPGQSGVAPFSADDPALVATSVVLVNNPSDVFAIGSLRLRDGAGRVLSTQSLKVAPFANAVVKLSKLARKAPTGVYLQIVNPQVAGAGKRRKALVGGGDFQAAVVSSTSLVANKKKAGTGDGSQLAILPFLPVDGVAVPTVVAPEVVRPDEDKKGYLTFDALAAGVGKAARLRMIGTNPVQEWPVKARKSVKLKLKTKALVTKRRLYEEWPLGEERTFVLIDDLSGQQSESVTLRRGEPAAGK